MHANRLFGIQSWVALPKPQEEAEPAFVHHPAPRCRVAEADGMRLRLIAGTGWGLAAPVATASPLFYADAALAPAAPCRCPEEHEERGAYVVARRGRGRGDALRGRADAAVPRRRPPRAAHGPDGARLLLGGAAMDGPRFIFWNFVSSSRERIEQAKADWKAGRFGKVPGDEHEFIPLPEGAAGRAQAAARVSEPPPPPPAPTGFRGAPGGASTPPIASGSIPISVRMAPARSRPGGTLRSTTGCMPMPKKRSRSSALRRYAKRFSFG